MHWEPIEAFDGKPEDDYLIFSVEYKISVHPERGEDWQSCGKPEHCVHMAHVDEGTGHWRDEWCSDERYCWYKPTHFMRLPLPPDASAEAAQGHSGERSGQPGSAGGQP